MRRLFAYALAAALLYALTLRGPALTDLAPSTFAGPAAAGSAPAAPPAARG